MWPSSVLPVTFFTFWSRPEFDFLGERRPKSGPFATSSSLGGSCNHGIKIAHFRMEIYEGKQGSPRGIPIPPVKYSEPEVRDVILHSRGRVWSLSCVRREDRGNCLSTSRHEAVYGEGGRIFARCVGTKQDQILFIGERASSPVRIQRSRMCLAFSSSRPTYKKTLDS